MNPRLIECLVHDRMSQLASEAQARRRSAERPREKPSLFATPLTRRASTVVKRAPTPLSWRRVAKATPPTTAPLNHSVPAVHPSLMPLVEELEHYLEEVEAFLAKHDQ